MTPSEALKLYRKLYKRLSRVYSGDPYGIDWNTMNVSHPQTVSKMRECLAVMAGRETL